MCSAFKSRGAIEVSALRFENVQHENSNFDLELLVSPYAFDSMELKLRICRQFALEHLYLMNDMYFFN